MNKLKDLTALFRPATFLSRVLRGTSNRKSNSRENHVISLLNKFLSKLLGKYDMMWLMPKVRSGVRCWVFGCKKHNLQGNQRKENQEDME